MGEEGDGEFWVFVVDFVLGHELSALLEGIIIALTHVVLDYILKLLTE